MRWWVVQVFCVAETVSTVSYDQCICLQKDPVLPCCSRPLLPSFHASFFHHPRVPIWSFSLRLSLSLSLSNFSHSFSPSPSLVLRYLQCGNAWNCLPLLIIRCICQGHGLVSGSDSPGASWESGSEEKWRGRRGEEERMRGGLVPRFPSVAWWCEVFNGGL